MTTRTASPTLVEPRDEPLRKMPRRLHAAGREHSDPPEPQFPLRATDTR